MDISSEEQEKKENKPINQYQKKKRCWDCLISVVKEDYLNNKKIEEENLNKKEELKISRKKKLNMIKYIFYSIFLVLFLFIILFFYFNPHNSNVSDKKDDKKVDSITVNFLQNMNKERNHSSNLTYILNNKNFSINNSKNDVGHTKEKIKFFRPMFYPGEFYLYKNTKFIQGTIVDNKYSIIKFLGTGAYANVFLVRCLVNNKTYALRQLKRKNPIFEKELYIYKKVSQIKEGDFIRLIDYGKANFDFEYFRKIKQYMVIEYAEKGKLSDYITKYGMAFNEKYAKVLFYKILKAVKVLHANNICHKDLKLSNILLDGNFTPKINDFGLSSEINPNKTKSDLNKKFDPEFQRKYSCRGFRTDIFNLGSILMKLVNYKIRFFGGRLPIIIKKFKRFLPYQRFEKLYPYYHNKSKTVKITKEFYG